MAEQADIGDRAGWGFFFRGQPQHLLLVLVLVPGALYLAGPGLDGGEFLGVCDRSWARLLIGVAVVHQVWVWLVWRTQLCFSLFTRLFGRADLIVWGFLFFPFLLARLALLVAVGLSDYGSLGAPRPLEVAAGLTLLVPGGYTIWCVFRYFGIGRALGGDHFRARYRSMPLVRRGAFRYTPNAMYSFGFCVFWAIALLCGSTAALALALFQHAYVWVHMYCTEGPDMEILLARK